MAAFWTVTMSVCFLLNASTASMAFKAGDTGFGWAFVVLSLSSLLLAILSVFGIGNGEDR